MKYNFLSNSRSRTFFKNEQAAWGKCPCFGNNPLEEHFLEDPVRVNALHITHKGKCSDRFQEAISSNILLKNWFSIHQDEDCLSLLARLSWASHEHNARGITGFPPRGHEGQCPPCALPGAQFFHHLDDPGLTPSTGLRGVTGPRRVQASAGHPGQLTEEEDCWFP